MYRTSEEFIRDFGDSWVESWVPVSGVLQGAFILVKTGKEYACVYQDQKTKIIAKEPTYAAAMRKFVKLSRTRSRLDLMLN